MTNTQLIAVASTLLVGCLLADCSRSSQYTILSIDECVRTAKLAMRDSDFTEDLRVVSIDGRTVVLGKHGGYKGRILCDTNKRTVEVSGLDPEQTKLYRNCIVSRF
jgi:hypothetical protein